MGRTTANISTPAFVCDNNSMRSNDGRQIDWDNVDEDFLDATSGKLVLPAGTVVGELLGSGKISPRVTSTNPATGILKTTAIQDDPSAALSGYGVYIGGVVYEDLLPDLDSTGKSELTTAGCTFQYLAYDDSSAS